MEQGSLLESNAVGCYETMTGNKVERVGFVYGIPVHAYWNIEVGGRLGLMQADATG